jgi:bifunctional DNA-binding transcriptional regulator/antitoxin component of YhaV-PrlF toxin-antitoxin module
MEKERSVHYARVDEDLKIQLPDDVRERLGIRPNDTVMIDIGRHSLIVIREPDDYVESIRGLGKEIWADVDIDDWLRREREA